MKEQTAEAARAEERRRCLGLVLAAFGEMKLDGYLHCADRLDVLATAIEHPRGSDEN